MCRRDAWTEHQVTSLNGRMERDYSHISHDVWVDQCTLIVPFELLAANSRPLILMSCTLRGQGFRYRGCSGIFDGPYWWLIALWCGCLTAVWKGESSRAVAVSCWRRHGGVQVVGGGDDGRWEKKKGENGGRLSDGDTFGQRH